MNNVNRPRYNKNIDINTLQVKSDIVDYLYNSIEINKYRYILLQNFNELKKLKENKYHVSPNFSGKNFVMIFVRIGENYYSVMIERKTLKYNKSYLNVDDVKILPIKIKANINIYKGTILDGKFIHTTNNKKVFYITDVYYLEGEDMTREPIENKMINIESYIEKSIKIDEKFSKFTFDTNKLYSYDDIQNIINTEVDNKLYKMYGIIFYPEISGTTILFNNIFTKDDRDNKDNSVVNTQVKSEDNIYIQLRKTDLTDVYETYILDDNDALVKNGVAYIPTMDCSKKCDKVFTDKQTAIFSCKYYDNFKKWCPIEEVSNIDKPDNLTKIKSYFASL